MRPKMPPRRLYVVVDEQGERHDSVTTMAEAKKARAMLADFCGVESSDFRIAMYERKWV